MKITKQRLKEIIHEEITREGFMDIFKKKEEPYRPPEKLAQIRAKQAARRAQKKPSQPSPDLPDLYNMVDEIRTGLGKVFKAYKEWPAPKAREMAHQFRTQTIGTGVSARPEKWERLVRDVSTAEGAPTTRDPSRESYTKFLAFLKGTK
jgi:hypothetical protein